MLAFVEAFEKPDAAVQETVDAGLTRTNPRVHVACAPGSVLAGGHAKPDWTKLEPLTNSKDPDVRGTGFEVLGAAARATPPRARS